MKSPDPGIEAISAALEKELGEISQVVDELVSDRITKLLKDLEASGDLLTRRRLAAEAVEDVQYIYDTAFLGESEYAEIAQKGLVDAGKAAQSRMAAEIGEAVKLASKDVSSLVMAARDTYDLAAENLTRGAVSELRSAITQEYLQGGSVEGLKSRLVKGEFLEDLEITDKLGRKRTLRAETRARMMANTEPKRISVRTYMDLSNEIEPDVENRYYRWVSTLAKNVGDDSLRRHGQLLSEKDWMTHDFGDGMYGLPPIRPNDNCTPVFTKVSWMTEKEKQAADAAPGDDSRILMSTDEELFKKRQKGDTS